MFKPSERVIHSDVQVWRSFWADKGFLFVMLTYTHFTRVKNWRKHRIAKRHINICSGVYTDIGYYDDGDSDVDDCVADADDSDDDRHGYCSSHVVNNEKRV